MNGHSREIVKRQLTRNGYQVITASDGVEALALVVAQHVDLVITDVLMPNMKGNELAAELAAVRPDARRSSSCRGTPHSRSMRPKQHCSFTNHSARVIC